MKLYLNKQSEVLTANMLAMFLEQYSLKNEGRWLDTVEHPYKQKETGDLTFIVLRYCDAYDSTSEFEFKCLDLSAHIRLSPEDTFVTEDGSMASHEDPIFRVDTASVPLQVDRWIYDENELLKPEWVFFEERQVAEEYINDLSNSN
jgi:hypothetical protein